MNMFVWSSELLDNLILQAGFNLHANFDLTLCITS